MGSIFHLQERYQATREKAWALYRAYGMRTEGISRKVSQLHIRYCLIAVCNSFHLAILLHYVLIISRLTLIYVISYYGSPSYRTSCSQFCATRAYVNWNSHLLERPKNHELSELRPYSATSFVLEPEERMDGLRNFPKPVSRWIFALSEFFGNPTTCWSRLGRIIGTPMYFFMIYLHPLSAVRLYSSGTCWDGCWLWTRRNFEEPVVALFDILSAHFHGETE
jgi:hypothetical protein